jgi:hypothetical protein
MGGDAVLARRDGRCESEYASFFANSPFDFTCVGMVFVDGDSEDYR